MSAASLKTTPAEAAFAEAFAKREPTQARRVAWDAYARTGLPHRRMEEWRWSDLRRASDRFADAIIPGQDKVSLTSGRAPDDRVALAEAPEAPMPALAGALAETVLRFRVEKGDPPLSFEVEALAGAGHHVIEIEVAEGVEARVEERYVGEDGAFANVALRFRVEPGARLGRIVRQPASPGAVIVSTASIELARDAALTQTVLAFGAALSRLETHVTHTGRGSRAVLDGAYLLDGSLHADLTTVVSHAGPGSVTEQLTKGAVRDQATGVFQGRIVVERGAQKTDARMGHHALLLTEGAAVNAKPELEIYADDVACAHGNTAGALDPAQIFYLQSRGLPEKQAKALVTEAFIAEAFERVADESVRRTLLDEVRAWLARNAP